jgi:hypothetical protein
VPASYRFLTTWVLDAPREPVWEAIHAIERWPEWWRGVECVAEEAQGDEQGIGAVFSHRWRSVLPYTVRFEVTTTRVERPFLMEGAARGGLEGMGRWTFSGDGKTTVNYEWNVRTTRPWMNTIAPIGRPVFAWSHNTIMRWGGECLAELLGARLLTQS